MSIADMRYGAATPYLRAWRAYRLLTQAELAKRAHIDRGTVVAAEAGRRIRLTSIGRLAKVLGVDRRTLVYEGPPDQPDRGDRVESSVL